MLEWIHYKLKLAVSAPSTSLIYDGKSLPESSPAYMNQRKIRDGIHDEKLKDYPKGLGWEGWSYALIFWWYLTYIYIKHRSCLWAYRAWSKATGERSLHPHSHDQRWHKARCYHAYIYCQAFTHCLVHVHRLYLQASCRGGNEWMGSCWILRVNQTS